MAAVPLGWVRLTLGFESFLVPIDSDAGIEESGGDARLDEVEMTYAVNALEWRGYDLRKVTVGVLLFDVDRPHRPGSQRNRMRAMERAKRAAGDRAEPPDATWDTGGLYATDKTSKPKVQWKVVGIDWSKHEAPDGTLLKVCGSVRLIERNDTDVVTVRARGPRTVEVKKGETFVEALKRGGVGTGPKRQREVLKASGIRDKRSVKRGTVLVIPQR